MNFQQQVQTWAKGDAIQGRIMVVFGLLFGGVLYYILTSESAFFDGMLIPIALLFLANSGYGGFLAFTRENHAKSAIESYEQNPKATIEKELEKAERDNKAYTRFKPIWIVLAVVALVLYFVLTADHYKGLMIGLILMFLGVFLLDVFLHRKLKPYLEHLRSELNNS